MFLHKEIYSILNVILQNEKSDKSAEELEPTALRHVRGFLRGIYVQPVHFYWSLEFDPVKTKIDQKHWDCLKPSWITTVNLSNVK